MFELKITSNEVMDGGTTVVSWCVDAETLKYLSDTDVADPQVVIIVAPEGRTYDSSKELRVVAPLKDLLAYVSFRCSGPNKIWGFISSKSKKEAKDYYLARDYNGYRVSVLSSDGTEYDYYLRKPHDEYADLVNAEPLSVVVPAGCFAKEPAQWEKDWVNHMFRSRVMDQCDFRRRRLFAYTVQPIIMTLNILARLVLLIVAILFGSKGMTTKYLLHPMITDLDDAFMASFAGTYFIRHVPEMDGNYWDPKNVFEVIYDVSRKIWTLPLMPLVFIPVLFIIHFGVVKIFLCVFAIVFVIAAFIAFMATGGPSAVMDAVLRIFVKEDDSLWYLNQNEMDLLTCSKQDGPMTFDKLPSRKKTLHLRFKDLKSKVCKPFSA